MFGKLFDWLTGSTTIEGTPSIQPNPSSVASVKYDVGTTYFIESEEFPVNSFTDQILQTAPVGFTIPNPTNVFLEPGTKQVEKTANTKSSNSPNKKGCSN
jgi:hypothetical protein